MSFKTSNDIIVDEVGSTSQITSEIIDMSKQYLFALQVTWANSAGARIITIETSLDSENWFTLTSPQITTGGASGTEIVQLTEFAYKWIRVSVNAGSATDLQIVFNGKGI